MAKGFAHFIVIIKAILTRIIFAAHGLIAIWQVTQLKQDPYYWYLCASILALTFEGVFTLTIKKNQEWKWFCPSVFFYLCSVVPAIWLLEVHKFDRRLALKEMAEQNKTAVAVQIPSEVLTAFENLNLGVQLDILNTLDEDTWATVIEQLLMLILIIGRWMLPKGGLTRDQLSQLLLVYIGTAADIIEFFDSFKDEKIASHRILCLLILGIWSWSLLQFTFVLTATKARRTRLTADIEPTKPKFVNGIYKVKEVCCSIDVWAILINIILQDAPFLIFRLLLITYYKIISYMNIFFTAKNTLVIVLQFYRLYVVQQEKNKELTKMAKTTVSGNLAKAIERAALMGPSGGATAAAALKGGKSKGKKSQGKGQSTSSSSSKQGQSKKNRSQESMNKVKDTKVNKMSLGGRRKSLSTGNLNLQGSGIEEVIQPFEDELELGMSGSALSGTNNEDSQLDESDEVDEDEVLGLDQISFTSETRNKGMGVAGQQRKLRMREQPGIFNISGSTRSSEATSSSQQGKRYRQDTGYSSSSRDSGHSGGTRRGRIVNGGSRTGQGARGNVGKPNRSAAQRRNLMAAAKPEQNSIEIGGHMEPEDLLATLGNGESFEENERIFQRRAAICAVFSLFVVIFMLCMVAIYGGINPKGLVLRETYRVANSTKLKPSSTTIAPSTTMREMEMNLSTIAMDVDSNLTRNSSSIDIVLIRNNGTTNDISYNNDTTPTTQEIFPSTTGEASMKSKERIILIPEKVEPSQVTPFQSSLLIPSVHDKENKLQLTSGMLRHSRQKVMRLYEVLVKEDWG